MSLGSSVPNHLIVLSVECRVLTLIGQKRIHPQMTQMAAESLSRQAFQIPDGHRIGVS